MNKTDRMFEVYSPTTGQVFGFFVGPAVEDVLEDAILTIDPVDLVDRDVRHGYRPLHE